jgi:hypothetical protein
MDTPYNRQIAHEYDALNSKWVEHNRKMWDGSLYGGINTRYGSAMDAVGNHPRFMTAEERGVREEFSGMGGARNAVADVGVYHPYRNLGMNTASYDIGACYSGGGYNMSRGQSGGAECGGSSASFGMSARGGAMSGGEWYNNWGDFVEAVEGVVETAKNIYNDYIKPALDVVGTPLKDFLKGTDNKYAHMGAEVLDLLGYGMYGRKCGKGGVRLRGRGGKMFEIHPTEIMEAGRRQGVHLKDAKHRKVMIGMADKDGCDVYHIDPLAIHAHLKGMKGGAKHLVGCAWYNDWDDFCDAVSGVVETAKGWWTDYIKPALDVVGTPLKEALVAYPPYGTAAAGALELLGYGDMQEVPNSDKSHYDGEVEFMEEGEPKAEGSGRSGGASGGSNSLGYSPHLNKVQEEEARGSQSYSGMPYSSGNLGGNAMGKTKAKDGFTMKGVEDTVPAGRENIWHGNEVENRQGRSGYANPSLVLEGSAKNIGVSKVAKKEVAKEMKVLKSFEGEPHWSDDWCKPKKGKKGKKVADPVHPITTLADMKGQWSAGAKPDKRKARAEIVKRIMKEKGLKMVEASKYVKEHGLYKP